MLTKGKISSSSVVGMESKRQVDEEIIEVSSGRSIERNSLIIYQVLQLFVRFLCLRVNGAG